jgi:hypothetical protein
VRLSSFVEELQAFEVPHPPKRSPKIEILEHFSSSGSTILHFTTDAEIRAITLRAATI